MMKNQGLKKRTQGLISFLRVRGKLWLLLGGALLGVLLLVLGSGGDAEVKQEQTMEGAAELAEYQEKIEREIAELCDAVAGVSGVEVSVTLGSGTRVVYLTDQEGEVVLSGSGSAREPVYQTVRPPTVVGVGVVCRGGDRADIQNTLTELLCATLQISSNRVYIAGK